MEAYGLVPENAPLTVVDSGSVDCDGTVSRVAVLDVVGRLDASPINFDQFVRCGRVVGLDFLGEDVSLVQGLLERLFTAAEKRRAPLCNVVASDLMGEWKDAR